MQLLGNCDTIVAELCRMVGWELKHEKLPGGTSNLPDMATNTNLDGSGQGGRAHWSLIEPNTYLFEGAVLEDIGYEPAGGGGGEEGGYAQNQPLGSLDEPNDGEEDLSDDGEDNENQRQEGELLLGASKKRGRNEPEDGGVGEGLLSSPVDEDSRRRQYSRTDQLGSVEPMSEDVVDFESDPEGHYEEGSGEKTASLSSSGFASSTWPASSEPRSPTWQQTSSSSSGLKSPSWQQTPVGIASGTTEPRTGSITEIHQDVLLAANAFAAATGASRSGTSTPNLHPLLSPSLQPTAHGTEDEAKIRLQYNEKMPKDLGEEEEEEEEEEIGEASDVPADLARHHPAHVNLGPHSLGLPAMHRRMSAELVPISEAQQEEQEEGGEEDIVLTQVEPMEETPQ